MLQQETAEVKSKETKSEANDAKADYSTQVGPGSQRRLKEEQDQLRVETRLGQETALLRGSQRAVAEELADIGDLKLAVSVEKETVEDAEAEVAQELQQKALEVQAEEEADKEEKEELMEAQKAEQQSKPKLNIVDQFIEQVQAGQAEAAQEIVEAMLHESQVPKNLPQEQTIDPSEEPSDADPDAEEPYDGPHERVQEDGFTVALSFLQTVIESHSSRAKSQSPEKTAPKDSSTVLAGIPVANGNPAQFRVALPDVDSPVPMPTQYEIENYLYHPAKVIPLSNLFPTDVKAALKKEKRAKVLTKKEALENAQSTNLESDTATNDIVAESAQLDTVGAVAGSKAESGLLSGLQDERINVEGFMRIPWLDEFEKKYFKKKL